MSLRVIFKDRDNDLKESESIIYDVDLEFERIKVKGSEKERALIAKIDGGSYYNSIEFIDRFGIARDLSELSTGCKAGLLILNSKEVIDTIECGINARDAILEICDKGCMLIYDTSITPAMDKETKVDIEILGKKINTASELIYYMREEEFM